MEKVKIEQSLPKKNTIDSYRSFLKNHILKKTNWDISNQIEFPKFHRFYRGFIHTLKDDGKADTQHHREIPASIIQKIYTLMKLLHQLIVKSPSDPKYDLLLEEIPQNFKGKHHYLLQYGKNYSFFLV